MSGAKLASIVGIQDTSASLCSFVGSAVHRGGQPPSCAADGFGLISDVPPNNGASRGSNRELTLFRMQLLSRSSSQMGGCTLPWRSRASQDTVTQSDVQEMPAQTLHLQDNDTMAVRDALTVEYTSGYQGKVTDPPHRWWVAWGWEPLDVPPPDRIKNLMRGVTSSQPRCRLTHSFCMRAGMVGLRDKDEAKLNPAKRCSLRVAVRPQRERSPHS